MNGAFCCGHIKQKTTSLLKINYIFLVVFLNGTILTLPYPFVPRVPNVEQIVKIKKKLEKIKYLLLKDNVHHPKYDHCTLFTTIGLKTKIRHYIIG